MRYLLSKTNIEKSIKYIKAYGFLPFLRKVKEKISSNQNKVIPASILMKSQNDQESQSIWDNSIGQYQKDNFKLYWELLPEVEKYQITSMTGDENLHYFWDAINYVKETIGEKNLKGLSIGCVEGNPGPEMSLFETGIFTKIEVMDIAGGLLKKQNKIAQEKGLNGIEYIRQDLNKVLLEKNAYDLIWAVGTVHHIENLELLFNQINNALKDKGIFFMREYIGPNRLQFTDLQLFIVNEILSILPEKYKRDPYGAVKSIMVSPDINFLKTVDPSESIRSKDIMPVMKEKLEIVKLSYTGGTILQPLLGGIASNFEGDENADTILKLLILLEKILIEKEVLPSDYVFCMAKKKLPVLM
jgi:SAM-dependent methyltransferase